MIEAELQKARALLAAYSHHDLSDIGRAKVDAAAAHTASEAKRHNDGLLEDQARSMRRMAESAEASRLAREAEDRRKAEERAAAQAALQQAMVTLVHRDGYVREFFPGAAERILREMPEAWSRQSAPEPHDDFEYDPPEAPSTVFDPDRQRRHEGLRRRALRRGAA